MNAARRRTGSEADVAPASIRTLLVVGAAIALVAWGGARAGGGGDLAVRGAIVHTSAGEAIEDGVVVIEDGVIVAVGARDEVEVPDGVDVLDAAFVTPGLIDAHSVVGLTGYLNQRQDQEQLERSEPIQPELRAIDAYDARERLIEWVRGFGVTTLHTGHGPGAIVSGQTMIVKTRGQTVDEAAVVPEAAVAVTLGEGALASGSGKSPGTRSKVVAMLRSALIDAAAYRDRRARAASDGQGDDDADDDERRRRNPSRDLRKEALVRVLEREMPLVVTAERHQDILTALRIAEEFGIDVLIDGASDAHLVVDRLVESGAAVLLHPTMARPFGARENASLRTAAVLDAAGVPFAFQSGFESYVPKTRVVLFEAAMTLAHGLGRDRALHALTLGAARILGVDDRVGSIEVGKHGDLALYDGDPFEYTSHCAGVVIDGTWYPGTSDAPSAPHDAEDVRHR